MEPKEIQKIIKSFEASTLTILEIEKDGFKLKLSKVNPTFKTETIQNSPKPENNKTYITSPLVGTFYTLGANQAPLVNVGDIVEKGQVLCLIEAMKIMNEITSPIKAKITKIYVNNKDAVGYNQVLMELEAYDK